MSSDIMSNKHQMERKSKAQLVYTVLKATLHHHETEQALKDECVMISNVKHFRKCCSQTAQSCRFGRIFRQTERVRASLSLGDGTFAVGDGVHVQSKDGPHHRRKHKPGLMSCS